MNATQTVGMNTSAAQAAFGVGASVDIYDTITDTVIMSNASLSAAVDLVVPAGRAVIAVACPAHSTFRRSPDGQVSVADDATGVTTVVRFRVPANTGEVGRLS